MGRDPSRKRPRRGPDGEIELDDDLVELASVIAEYTLEANAAGWFTLPWKSGWSVVRLLLDFDRVAGGAQTPHRYELEKLMEARADDREVYHLAEDCRIEAPTRALRAAWRCVQILISKSHGGGHVYNDIVRPIFDAHTEIETFAPIVLDARCHDALGVGVQLQNDRFDRQRRAFRIAWQRGLYLVAYAIQPVKR